MDKTRPRRPRANTALRAWARKFGIPPAELLRAVEAVSAELPSAELPPTKPAHPADGATQVHIVRVGRYEVCEPVDPPRRFTVAQLYAAVDKLR